MVRMTSFAEQKFRKLEGRSSGGTTPESSELNLSYPRPTRALSLEVGSPPANETSLTVPCHCLCRHRDAHVTLLFMFMM